MNANEQQQAEDATARIRTPEAEEAEEPAEPAEPARNARRRRIVRRTVKTVAALAVVLAFLAVGDRWAVLYAENLAAQQVQKTLKLRAEPEVHVDGFPFLTQVATGGLDHVRVNVPDVPAGPVSLAQVQVDVDDIRILGSLPSSVRGAELGRVRGAVFLEFADLNREVGASLVKLTPGRQKNTVLARGELPVAGEQVKVRARAHVQRTGDRGLRLEVAGARLVVPGVLTYTPGKGGGLQLAAPTADKVDEGDLQDAAGSRVRPDQLLKGRALDALVEHPALLKPTGIDPSLIEGLRKVQEPKVAEAMEFSAELPDDMPVDLRLRGVTVTDDGVLVELSGKDVALEG